jgi:hypothetical protein
LERLIRYGNEVTAAEVRDLFGRSTSVYIPQIGEGEAENDSAASSFPLRRRPNFDLANQLR